MLSAQNSPHRILWGIFFFDPLEGPTDKKTAVVKVSEIARGIQAVPRCSDSVRTHGRKFTNFFTLK
jgi:hypothetical protein